MLNREERKREKYWFYLLEESTYSPYTTSTGLMSRFHSCSPTRILKFDNSCFKENIGVIKKINILLIMGMH